MRGYTVLWVLRTGCKVMGWAATGAMNPKQGGEVECLARNSNSSNTGLQVEEGRTVAAGKLGGTLQPPLHICTPCRCLAADA